MTKNFFSFAAFLLIPLISSEALARITYDLGVSSGTSNNRSYSEIQLGLNWSLSDFLVWRNSIYNRSGADIKSSAGLDTSARFVFDSGRDEKGVGFSLFAGPGLRISDKENTGVFGEAGLTVKAAGLTLGGGVKAISYNSPGTDSSGRPLSQTDTVVFLILAGGGAL